MARGGGSKYYCVANGRQTGIYRSWDECKSHVDGYSGAKFKSFSSESEARSYLSSAPSTPSASRVSSAGSSYRPSYTPSSVTHVSRQSTSSYGSGGSSSRSSAPASSQPRQQQVVYVDGSCLANGQSGKARGGYGCYYGDNDARNVSAPLDPNERQTNNRGELKAVLHAVRRATSDGSTAPLNIHTDSKYCIDGVTKWQQGWKQREYSGVENSDLWKDIDRAIADRQRQYTRATGHSAESAVTFTHVRGHSGVHGNEMADRLAVQGSMKHGGRDGRKP